MTTAEDILRVGAELAADPKAWQAMTLEQQTVLRALLPDSATGFSPEQRAFIAPWWLACSPEECAAANAAVAHTGTVLTLRTDTTGATWLSADVLSDALDERRLSAAFPILKTLPLHRKPPTDWPAPPSDL